HRAGAVGDALAALEHAANGRVRLPPLKLLVGVEVRIAVRERDDETGVHASAGRVIQEAAAVEPGERPAGRVQHVALAVPRRVDLPDLLEADRVVLRGGAGPQAEPPLERAAEMAAASRGDDRVLRAQLVARRAAGLRGPVAADAEIA